MKMQTILKCKCRGKVTHEEREDITVMLFTPSEEIVGEFHRRQFPRGKIYVGRCFDYQATVSNGVTTVTIKWFKL